LPCRCRKPCNLRMRAAYGAVAGIRPAATRQHNRSGGQRADYGSGIGRNFSRLNCESVDDVSNDACKEFCRDSIWVATWSGETVSTCEITFWSVVWVWVCWAVTDCIVVVALARAVWISAIVCWPGWVVSACATLEPSAATCAEALGFDAEVVKAAKAATA
jgi:hypothetical protein